MNEVKQGTWHRRCYQDATLSGMLMRQKKDMRRYWLDQMSSRRKTRNLQEAKPINQLTRSKTIPYNKAVCFAAMVKDVIGKSSGKLEPCMQESQYVKLLN